VAGTIEFIREFLRSTGSVKAGDDLFSDTVDLLDYGYLDSFGIVGLMETVQSRFGIDLSDVDFYAPEHRTIAGISALIDARLARKA
jgi:acyl carrier protein